MDLTFIISIISLAIDIYFWLIVARVILSFIRPRTYHPIIRFIYEITDLCCPFAGECFPVL